MVADAFDVLGAEQQMRAGRDVARIFHHVGQQFAEQRGVHRVDFLVAFADAVGLLDRARRIDVEHFLELDERQLGQMFQAAGKLAWQARIGNGDHALGIVLAKVADAFQVGRDADGADDFTQVGRHRLAPWRW